METTTLVILMAAALVVLAVVVGLQVLRLFHKNDELKEKNGVSRAAMLSIAALMFTLSAQAQFPNDVKDVLKKCDEKMTSYKTDAGLVFDMDLKLKVSVLSLKGSMKAYVKAKKYFNDMSLGVMNKKLKMEMGFDGTQKWSYRSNIDEKKKDSLIITKTQTVINDYAMKNDYEKEYKKAKMKEVGNYYEITFSGPKQKD